MLRRQLIGCALAAAMPTLGNAQVVDLNDAINKAGRQRMLSQRMAKAWFAIAHDVEANAARSVLDRSMGLFDRQLVELKAFAPGAEIRDVYDRLDAAWSEFKTVLDATNVILSGGDPEFVGEDGGIEAFLNAGMSLAALMGELIEFSDTKTIFTTPRDRRTEDYVTGRFG